MQEQVQEQVQEQPEPVVTAEQVEEEMFAEAAALAGLTEADSEPPPSVTDQADPDPDEVTEDPAGAEASPGEEPPVEAAPPDPFEDATPAQQQAWKDLVEKNARLEHSSVSNSNRVSALQKKVNSLEQAQPEPKETPSAKTAEPEEPGIEAVDFDMREFEEDFPEIYKAVNGVYQQKLGELQKRFDQRLEKIDQRVETVAQPVERLQEDRQNMYRKSQMDALKTVHPDFNKIQEKPEFWSWLDSQSEGIKALAGSVAAQDNIALLNIYKSGLAPQTGPPPPGAGMEPPASPRRQPTVGIPRAASGGLTSQGVDPNDGDGAWEYWSENYDKL